MTSFRTALLLLLASMSTPSSLAQEAIYDESKLPSFTLPDPLAFADGQPVRSPEDWTTRRRAELLDLFKQQVYGIVPDNEVRFHPRTDSVEPDALDEEYDPYAVPSAGDSHLNHIAVAQHQVDRGPFRALEHVGNGCVDAAGTVHFNHHVCRSELAIAVSNVALGLAGNRPPHLSSQAGLMHAQRSEQFDLHEFCD